MTKRISVAGVVPARRGRPPRYHDFGLGTGAARQAALRSRQDTLLWDALTLCMHAICQHPGLIDSIVDGSQEELVRELGRRMRSREAFAEMTGDQAAARRSARLASRLGA